MNAPVVTSRVWPTCVTEALALHEMFRRMGFPADDLFVHVYGPDAQYPDRRRHVQFQAVQGVNFHKRTMTIDINEDCSQFTLDLWAQAVAWWNKATDDEMFEIYFNSKALSLAVPLLGVLIRKGMTPNGQGWLERLKSNEFAN